MTSVTINLSNGKYFFIDEEDLILIAGRACVIRNHGYVDVLLPDKKREYLHRLVARAKEGEIVDHIDGNKLNNCHSNLRIVTRSQNLFNRGKAKHNQSGFKGVYYCKQTGKYRAEIRYEKKVSKLGRYVTAEEAAKAYDKAAIALHGVCASLNFPEDFIQADGIGSTRAA